KRHTKRERNLLTTASPPFEVDRMYGVSFVRAWLRRTPGRGPRRRARPRFGLTVEGLERRELLDVGFSALPAAVNEGSTGTVAFSGAPAGSRYSYDFDIDGTFEIAGSTAASATVPASYLADGPGSRTVRGRLTDSGGATTDYTSTITVNNVAPTATFTNTGPADPTDPYVYAYFPGASEPSPVDA